MHSMNDDGKAMKIFDLIFRFLSRYYLVQENIKLTLSSGVDTLGIE